MTTMMLLMAVMLWAQGNPVHFTVSQKQVSDTEIDVIFKGKIAAGWHVYAPNIPADGPIPATITTEKSEGVKAMGKLKAQGKEIKEYDQIFGMQLRYFENNVTFVQRYKITGKTYSVKGYLEYGACNDTGCMPPTSVELHTRATVLPMLPKPRKRQQPTRPLPTLQQPWHRSLPILPLWTQQPSAATAISGSPS